MTRIFAVFGAQWMKVCKRPVVLSITHKLSPYDRS
jgi:hypothetical protein